MTAVHNFCNPQMNVYAPYAGGCSLQRGGCGRPRTSSMFIIVDSFIIAAQDDQQAFATVAGGQRRTNRRGVMHRLPRVSSILALLFVGFGFAISSPALAEDPFGPIRVAANRGSYNGPCPVTIVFTGNINYAAHPEVFTYSYYWVRSDGARSRVFNARRSRGQHLLVVRDTWRFGARGSQYDVSETLFVNSGNTHLQEQSRTIPVRCR